MSNLKLDNQDRVLLESLAVAAVDDVVRAQPSARSDYAPESGRVFEETTGNEDVFLGTGSSWVNVSDATPFVADVLSGGTVEATDDGPANAGELSFSNTRLYEDANGEVVVEDSAGNTTTLS